VVAIFASSGVGLVLAMRRGDNPIGWLLLANGLVLTANGVAEAYAEYAVLAHPGALPVASGRCCSRIADGRRSSRQ
jgi:hypothetical protein